MVICIVVDCEGHQSILETLLHGQHHIMANLGTINQRLDRIINNQETTVGAIEDLQAVDADLAAAVTDLSGAVDRIDADFVKLEQAVAEGNAAAIEAEVANLRATVDAAKAAKANIDTTDPVPAPVEPPVV